MVSKADLYRAEAKQLEQRAEQATDRDIKAALLTAAIEWRDIALALDRGEPKRKRRNS